MNDTVTVVMMLINGWAIAAVTLALIVAQRDYAADRKAMVADLRAMARQGVRADLSRTAREYEQAEAIGAAIENRASRQAEDGYEPRRQPPIEGLG